MGATKIAAHSWKLVTTRTNFQPSFLTTIMYQRDLINIFTAKTVLVSLIVFITEAQNLVSQNSQQWEVAYLQ